MRKCFLCGRNGTGDPLDRHHCFSGALRKKSEKYGLVVDLCHHRCHIDGKAAVHRNPESRAYVQKWAQMKAMEENGWTVEEFRMEFGRNYLDEEDMAGVCIDASGNDFVLDD